MANLQVVSTAATMLMLLLLLNLKAKSVNCSNIDVSSRTAQCRNIGSTFPPPNSLACYRTTIIPDNSSSFPTCEAALLRDGPISVVGTSTNNYTVMVVHTPGRLLNRTYIDRLLCRWDIRCPEGQLIYYDMAEHSIEPKRSSPLFENMVCVDYLNLQRDRGMEESCGTVDSYADLESNNLRIEFRSNNNLTFPGFKLRIVCFNPDLQDIQGCSQVQKRSTRSIKSGKQQGQLQPLLHPRPHTLRSRRTRQATQVQQMTLDEDSSVTYNVFDASDPEFGNLLEVIALGSITLSMNGIRSFHATTSLDGLVSYFSNQEQFVELRGPGFLTINPSDGSASYFQTGVDDKFMPSPSQRDAIGRMLDAEEPLVVNNDFIIDEGQGSNPVSTPQQSATQSGATTKPPLDSSADNPITDIPQQSVTATQSRGMFSSDVIATAQAGANSCNAAVRAVSQSVLDLNS